MYLLYRLLSRVPLVVLYPLATILAWLAEHVVQYRRATIMQNLRAAFPEHPLSTLQHYRQAFYRHLSTTFVEILHARHLSDAELREAVTLVNGELLAQVSEQFQQSVIIMTLHQGNWEWLLQRAAAEYPLPMAPLYKRLHSAGADRFMYELRSLRGSTPVEMRQSTRNFLKHRRQARFVIALADQSPGLRERAHWSPFLNQDTAFYTGPASLARATGFPVVFADCRRVSRGRYTCQLTEICRQPKTLTDAEITERYVRLTEAAIKRDPANWLWSNRRWKVGRPAPSSEAQAETSASIGADDTSTQGKPVS